jgi:hypothetical protein
MRRRAADSQCLLQRIAGVNFSSADGSGAESEKSGNCLDTHYEIYLVVKRPSCPRPGLGSPRRMKALKLRRNRGSNKAGLATLRDPPE